ncbi:hypothetical protein, conserved [Eimeria maxima]|uniref:PH domain-containing protein n=1 Tax=Eimeria maxima TaxID=5804 RepID=U6M7P8_EIMMA|nr:hypothetical protein, conserved [Eimeria maxima]CDJ59078.1 hypothetical protein, conserved [Eimeria maxima]
MSEGTAGAAAASLQCLSLLERLQESAAAAAAAPPVAAAVADEEGDTEDTVSSSKKKKKQQQQQQQQQQEHQQQQFRTSRTGSSFSFLTDLGDTFGDSSSSSSSSSMECIQRDSRSVSPKTLQQQQQQQQQQEEEEENSLFRDDSKYKALWSILRKEGLLDSPNEGLVPAAVRCCLLAAAAEIIKGERGVKRVGSGEVGKMDIQITEKRRRGLLPRSCVVFRFDSTRESNKWLNALQLAADEKAFLAYLKSKKENNFAAAPAAAAPACIDRSSSSSSSSSSIPKHLSSQTGSTPVKLPAPAAAAQQQQQQQQQGAAGGLSFGSMDEVSLDGNGY